MAIDVIKQLDDINDDLEYIPKVRYIFRQIEVIAKRNSHLAVLLYTIIKFSLLIEILKDAWIGKDTDWELVGLWVLLFIGFYFINEFEHWDKSDRLHQRQVKGRQNALFRWLEEATFIIKEDVIPLIEDPLEKYKIIKTISNIFQVTNVADIDRKLATVISLLMDKETSVFGRAKNRMRKTKTALNRGRQPVTKEELNEIILESTEQKSDTVPGLAEDD
jgi:hypothetical protein